MGTLGATLNLSTKFPKREIVKLVKKTEKEIGKELPGLKIVPLYQGRKSVRFRLKYSAKERLLSDFRGLALVDGF